MSIRYIVLLIIILYKYYSMDNKGEQICINVDDFKSPEPVNLEQTPENMQEIITNFHFVGMWRK